MALWVGNNMASNVSNDDIRKPASTFKSAVWKHFGFLKSDEQKVVCLQCKAILKYSGNTTNMMFHRKRHHNGPTTHEEVTKLPSSSKDSHGQMTLAQSFGQKLHKNSTRATAITNAISGLLVDSMLPFSVVDGKAFRQLMKVSEPRYTVPERHFFSENAIPKMYSEAKVCVIDGLKQASRVAITTDGWTSRATQSYITVTAHYINLDWELCSSVLQTRLLPESHTGVNIGNVLTKAGIEWGFTKKHPALVSDNASNMDVAAAECGFEPHIKCFAHTLNLASQRALNVNQVSRLLGRVRRIVTFFHKSTSAYAVLQEKQILLGLPHHKLIQDVSTRWNSSFDMLERYLEQQPAISAALMHKDLRNRAKDISSVREEDIFAAEDIVGALKSVKSATTVMCSEQLPTLSMVYPLYHQILSTMKVSDTEKPVIREMKMAFTKDLQKRYQQQMEFLATVSALDPRFKSLPFQTDGQRLMTYSKLAIDAAVLSNQVEVKEEPHEQPSTTTTEAPPLPRLPVDPDEALSTPNVTSDSDVGNPMLQLQPSSQSSACETATSTEADQSTGPRMNKKLKTDPQRHCALNDLFQDVFVVSIEPAKPATFRAEKEVESYKEEPTLPLNGDPLAWWKANAHKYPLLSKVAKHNLCIPATSVPSERVFSKAGELINDRRACLKPKLVDQLIFLNKNYKI